MQDDGYKLPKGGLLGKNYQVLEFLGQGWEGEVYKVEERQTGILRAAKLFYKHPWFHTKPHVIYAKKQFKLRTCPIIIQYHNHDVTDIKKESVDYLISEFVDGEVLSQYIQRQPKKRLQPYEALHLFYSLVQGVEQVHYLGEYHGDIHTDNIIMQRKGLGYNIKLIDLLNLGKSTKTRIQADVFDLIQVFYEMLGGQKAYSKLNKNLKQIIMGQKKTLISKKFKQAGHIRLMLENLDWD